MALYSSRRLNAVFVMLLLRSVLICFVYTVRGTNIFALLSEYLSSVLVLQSGQTCHNLVFEM